MKKPKTTFVLALVTTPNLPVARRMVKTALKSRLIACANLLPGIESHYWWQGKVESGREILMILKTTKTRLRALEKLIESEHPYDTPEFLVLTLAAGNKKYLAWLASSLG